VELVVVDTTRGRLALATRRGDRAIGVTVLDAEGRGSPDVWLRRPTAQGLAAHLRDVVGLPADEAMAVTERARELNGAPLRDAAATGRDWAGIAIGAGVLLLALFGLAAVVIGAVVMVGAVT